MGGAEGVTLPTCLKQSDPVIAHLEQAFAVGEVPQQRLVNLVIAGGQRTALVKIRRPRVVARWMSKRLDARIASLRRRLRTECEAVHSVGSDVHHVVIATVQAVKAGVVTGAGT